ncbi:unnamed protein product [Acanthoscelides obtectus]|uniref:Uncharacterized protein n=1 Tax=Acanthoscelides obtectus TaxID=200917 RepID=A0A9P0K2D6_ACAOB|nr:unnamed protein product [Acanthoscelides obtectus]CAK1648120.1 hypothetical protein AOBTE_LOCUS15547 [Acanthoscelides obtectus]
MDMSLKGCVLTQIMLLLLALNLKCTSGHCYTRWPSCGNIKNIVCLTDYGKPAPSCEIIHGQPKFRYEYEITESNEKVFQDFSRLKAVLIGYLYQMIWAETYRVGCGRSIQEKKYYMMICNYGPRGLRVTKPLGRIGRPCTKCPETISCNQAYPGLCGEIDESHYSVTVSGGVNIICSSLNLRIVLFCLVITTTSM